MTKKQDSKWTREELINEARSRMAGIKNPTRASIEVMLYELTQEAEWSGEELLDVLCTDVVRRSTRPPPKVSGTMQKLNVAIVQKSAANVRRR